MFVLVKYFVSLRRKVPGDHRVPCVTPTHRCRPAQAARVAFMLETLGDAPPLIARRGLVPRLIEGGGNQIARQPRLPDGSESFAQHVYWQRGAALPALLSLDPRPGAIWGSRAWS